MTTPAENRRRIAAARAAPGPKREDPENNRWAKMIRDSNDLILADRAGLHVKRDTKLHEIKVKPREL